MGSGCVGDMLQINRAWFVTTMITAPTARSIKPMVSMIMGTQCTIVTAEVRILTPLLIPQGGRVKQ